MGLIHRENYQAHTISTDELVAPEFVRSFIFTGEILKNLGFDLDQVIANFKKGEPVFITTPAASLRPNETSNLTLRYQLKTIDFEPEDSNVNAAEFTFLLEKKSVVGRAN